MPSTKIYQNAYLKPSLWEGNVFRNRVLSVHGGINSHVTNLGNRSNRVTKHALAEFCPSLCCSPIPHDLLVLKFEYWQIDKKTFCILYFQDYLLSANIILNLKLNTENVLAPPGTISYMHSLTTSRRGLCQGRQWDSLCLTVSNTTAVLKYITNLRQGTFQLFETNNLLVNTFIVGTASTLQLLQLFNSEFFLI